MIQNFSLDANQYKSGDTANIPLLLSPSADIFPQNRSRSMGTLFSGTTLVINIISGVLRTTVFKVDCKLDIQNKKTKLC